MPLNAEQALEVVKALTPRLEEQGADAEKPLAYYRGEHNMAFATPEFQQAFGGLFKGWADNWCGVVVDSVAERLAVTGFKAGGQREAHAATWDLWQRSGAAEDLDAAIVTALAGSRAAATIWYPAAEGGAVQIDFEHPSQMIVDYEPGSRRRRRYAMKQWADEDGTHATLYTVDQVWKFSRAKGEGWVPREIEGEPWPLPHDLGDVPVVELRNKPDLLGNATSEILQVIPKQDAVNLLWAHVMTASDAAALPQRVVLGVEAPKVPEVGEDGKVSMRDATREEVDRMRQRRMGFLPNKDARLGEWSAADLSGIVSTIEVLVRHIAAQSKTPPQYLLGQMANLSGDALSAAETGLVSKVLERQTDFGTGALREVMRLAHLANGDKANAAAIAGGSVVWKDAEHRTLGELVDALLKKQALGVPLEVLWAELGYDQTEIGEFLDKRAALARASRGEATEPPPAADPAA